MNILIDKVKYRGFSKIITGKDQERGESFTIKSSRIPFTNNSSYFSKKNQIKMINRKRGLILIKGNRFYFETSLLKNYIKIMDVNNSLIVTFLKYKMHHCDGNWAKFSVIYTCNRVVDEFVIGVRLLSSQSLVKIEFERTELNKIYVNNYTMDFFKSIITWYVLNRYYL